MTFSRIQLHGFNESTCSVNTTDASGFLISSAAHVAQRLAIETETLWPPSRQSAPVLTVAWLALATTLYALSFRVRTSAEYESAKTKRKNDKLKALKNLVTMEELRLASFTTTTTTTTTKKATAASSDNVCISDEPPTARHVYDIIFEEVEEEPASVAVGIASTNPWCLRAVALFKHRVRAEITEATDRTVAAQRVAATTGGADPAANPFIRDHADGEKLAAVLQFTRDEAVKHFGEHRTATAAPDPSLGLPHFDAAYGGNGAAFGLRSREHASAVTAADEVLAEVRKSHRNALLYIVDLLMPVLPTYFSAIFCMLCARAFEAPLWAYALPSYKSAVAMINPDAAEGEFGYGPEIEIVAHSHAIMFVVGFLFSRPIEMLASSLGDKAAEDFSHPLRRAVMGAIMRQDTEYFDVHPSAKLQERLNKDTNELVENLLWVPRRIFEFTFRVVQRMCTLYFVAPSMLTACLWFNVPMFSLVVLSTGPVLHRLYGKRERTNEIAAAETLEILQKVKTVRQFSMEKKEQDEYTVKNMGRGVFEGRIHVLESLTHTLRHTCHMAGELYVIFVALSLAVSGEAKVADAIVASTVGMWLQHDMKNLLEQVPKLLKVMTPIRRVASLLASKPLIECSSQAAPDPSLLRPHKFEGRIEFRDVTFSYPTERQKQVLGGLSFTASPGQKVAFVGKAGCGKSTAIDLLQRFYNRTGGEIVVDGHRIEAYDTNNLRMHCGVVSQTSTLFNRSVYSNIVYGMEHPPGPESAEFMDVCRKAEVWEFLRKFPNKQYTLLGEDNNGVKLSGGQKQRISIARVIIRQPTFLLLDEATSALDAINEKSVQAALDEMLAKHKGVALVVAHRLTTICNCDKIVVLGDDGIKVEEGTHAELMRVPKQVDEEGNPVVGAGLYHTLWDTQQVTVVGVDYSAASGAASGGGGGGRATIDESSEEAHRLRTELERCNSELKQLKREVAEMRTSRQVEFRKGRALSVATAVGDGRHRWPRSPTGPATCPASMGRRHFFSEGGGDMGNALAREH